MAKYLISRFDSFEILHVPREVNVDANRVARIGLRVEANPICPVVSLFHSSIDGTSINIVDKEETGMTPIINYLVKEELPSDKKEARVLRRRVAHFAFEFGQLYKRGYSIPLLKCVTP